MSARRMLVLALAAVLATFGLTAPVSAVGEVSLTATITNSDDVPQNGSVCLELVVDSEGCGGTNFTNGAWSHLQAPGDYLIRVTSSTMDGTARWYQQGNPAGAVLKADATPVHLVTGDPEFHFDMVMPAIAKVTGFVLDNHGGPAVGATVVRNQGGHQRNAITDATGKYDFGYVRSGDHTLTVPPHGENAGTSGSMTVPASGAYVAPQLTVQRAAAIHGTVTDTATGEPVSLVYVQVFTAGTHQPQGSAYTDLNGDYRIPQLGNQPLVARFTDEYGGYVRKLYVAGDPTTWENEESFTLAAEQDKQVDIAMTPKALDPAPPHTLSGQVTGPGGVPLPGIAVTAGGEYDETDRDGRWYLNAPVGSHLLRFDDASRWGPYVFGDQPGWFPEYYPDASTEAAGSPVTVTAGPAQDDLDVELERGAFIRGTVLDELDQSTGFVPAWRAYDADGTLDVEQTYTGDPSYTAFVRPGTWRMVISALRNLSGQPQAHYLPRWYGAGNPDSFAAATPITVTAGEIVTGKDVHLTTALNNTAPPVVSGVRAAGKTLTASTGVWSTMTLTQFATTWWRGSTQVGSGASYVVKPADAGQALRARVVATNNTLTATAFSAQTAIAKLVSTATLRGTSPGAGKARLVIAVRAAGLAPTGTVVIRRGTKIVKRVRLVGGKATVVLSRQPKGVQRYQVSYPGSTQVLPDSSPVLRLRVR